MVYVDEAGIDNREEHPYGYCEIGQRFHALKSGKRTERVSWIAALKQDKLFAPMTFLGCCNRDLFQMWLEKCLLPQLQAGDIIIIDNASFHRSQTIDEIVAASGCELWYLPAYSPDLNKIEHWCETFAAGVFPPQSFRGLCLKIGCDSDGMNLTTFVIVLMPHSNTVLTYFRRAITITDWTP